MSGAALQGYGQIRNGYPFMVDYTLDATLTLASGGVVQNQTTPLNQESELPFDYGPDKGSRVYMHIQNAQIIYTMDVGTSLYVGWLHFIPPNGREITLCAMGSEQYGSFSVPTIQNIPINITPNYSYNATGVQKLGDLRSQQVAYAPSGGNLVLTASLKLRVGFYSDYGLRDAGDGLAQLINRLFEKKRDTAPDDNP